MCPYIKIPISLIDVLLLENQEEAILFHDQFISGLREKTYPSTIQLEKHHVLPRHAGGTDLPENLIKISPEDHVAAHFYRYQAFREKGDKQAYEMRLSDTNELAKQRAQAAVAANKLKKQLFWDKDWQSVQGKKGGSKSGKLNTPAQWAARQKVGLTYGKSVGLSNQSDSLKFILSHYLEWVFEPDQSLFTTPPIESVAALVRELEFFKPGQIKRASAFYKVIHGLRPRMYGWKLVNMVIRSEAGEG